MSGKGEGDFSIAKRTSLAGRLRVPAGSPVTAGEDEDGAAAAAAPGAFFFSGRFGLTSPASKRSSGSAKLPGLSFESTERKQRSDIPAKMLDAEEAVALQITAFVLIPFEAEVLELGDLEGEVQRFGVCQRVSL
jgi:hypothetical protein